MEFVEESLRQNRFWLRQMFEHAIFIRLGLPCIPKTQELIKRAMRQENIFRELWERALHTPPNPVAVRNLNNDVLQALPGLIFFKTKVLNLVITCRINAGSNLPLLIDHVRREAMRFKVILIRLQNNIQLPSAEEALQEEIFWLRIMGDHAWFIAHLLDPSERMLVKQSEGFAMRFEQLRLQANDLDTMLNPQEFENFLLPAEDVCEGKVPSNFCQMPEAFVIPRLQRFNQEAIQATQNIVDFKETALQLVTQCKVLSLISPTLAAHVLREALMAIDDLTRAQSRIEQN